MGRQVLVGYDLRRGVSVFCLLFLSLLTRDIAERLPEARRNGNHDGDKNDAYVGTHAVLPQPGSQATRYTNAIRKVAAIEVTFVLLYPLRHGLSLCSRC